VISFIRNNISLSNNTKFISKLNY